MQRRTTRFVLMLPSGLIFLFVFVAPFLNFFVISFWSVDFFKLTPGFSFENYREAVSGYADIGGFTVYLASITSILTVLLGFLYAFIIRFKSGRWGQLLLFIVLTTLFGGYLMKIYAWKTILGNEGLLNTGLISMGIINQPISALLYSPGAMVVTLVHFGLPFSVLPIYASMRGIRDIEIEAARDLGARPLTVLSNIIVPRCRNGLVTAFAFSFLITAGDYVTPQMVGGKQTIIGNMIVQQFGEFFNWPLGSAMSFTMLVVALVVIAAVGGLVGRWGRP